MRVLRSIFNFYLDASIHVAFAVVALYIYTVLELNKNPNFYLIGFLFLSTIVCYNFMKYGVEAEKYLLVKKPYHKIIQVFSFLCFPFAVYCFLNLSKELWFPIAFLTLLSGLYILPFLPSSKNLRTLGGFKIYLVALVWVGFTVFLPILEYGITYGLEVLFRLLRRFVLVLVLFVPFEIRDLKVDPIELKTLPQRIGVEKTKKVGFVLAFFYFLISIFIDYSLSNCVLELIVFATLWVAITFAKKEQQKFYASFWIEGVPIFLLAVCFVLKKLI